MQINKLARIGARLCLQPGHHILDIGCGWGRLANALYEMQPNISVTGITPSEIKHTYGRQKAQQDQRGQHLKFELCDYRHQRGVLAASYRSECLSMLASVISTAILQASRDF